MGTAGNERLGIFWRQRTGLNGASQAISNRTSAQSAEAVTLHVDHLMRQKARGVIAQERPTTKKAYHLSITGGPLDIGTEGLRCCGLRCMVDSVGQLLRPGARTLRIHNADHNSTLP